MGTDRRTSTTRETGGACARNLAAPQADFQTRSKNGGFGRWRFHRRTCSAAAQSPCHWPFRRHVNGAESPSVFIKLGIPRSLTVPESADRTRCGLYTSSGKGKNQHPDGTGLWSLLHSPRRLPPRLMDTTRVLCQEPFWFFTLQSNIDGPWSGIDIWC